MTARRKVILALSVAVIVLFIVGILPLLLLLNRHSSCKEADSLVDEGIKYCEEYNIEKAMTCFTRAIELCPSSARAYIYRGMLYAGMNEFFLAISDLDKAVSLEPGNPDAYAT